MKEKDFNKDENKKYINEIISFKIEAAEQPKEKKIIRRSRQSQRAS